MSESEDQDQDGARRVETATRVLSLLYAAASLAWLAWMLVPEHRKKLLVMQAVAAARSATATLAFRTGHAAMGRELRRHVAGYGVPYRLSLMRDQLAGVYDRMRYT